MLVNIHRANLKQTKKVTHIIWNIAKTPDFYTSSELCDFVDHNINIHMNICYPGNIAKIAES